VPGLPNDTYTCCYDSTNNNYQNSNKDLCCSTRLGSSYSWNGGTASWSTSGCGAACTSTYGATQSYGYMTMTNTYYDSCDGNLTSQYTCPGGVAKTCTDFFQTGGCTTSGTTQAAAWTLWSDTVEYNSPQYTVTNKPASTCTQSAINYISPSTVGNNADTAMAMCQAQCNGLIGGNTPCTSSCQVIGNCWANANGVGVYCQVRQIQCTTTSAPQQCQLSYRSVTCC